MREAKKTIRMLNAKKISHRAENVTATQQS